MKKFISMLISIMIVLVMFAMPVLAESIPTPDMTKITETGAKTAAETILGVVKFLGYAIAIGMLIYVGIKYVMASANEKADLKNALVKYVIGAILIAGATAVAGWIFDIGSDL